MGARCWRPTARFTRPWPRRWLFRTTRNSGPGENVFTIGRSGMPRALPVSTPPMAVTILPRSQARTTDPVGRVHPSVLLVALVVPGLDLLALVQTHVVVQGLSLA